jgi:hypothetical protein
MHCHKTCGLDTLTQDSQVHIPDTFALPQSSSAGIIDSRMNPFHFFAVLSSSFLVWSKPVFSTRHDLAGGRSPLSGTTTTAQGRGERRRLATNRALTGLILYDTTTKTNMTLTNNMNIISADPKYSVVAALSGTSRVESVRFLHSQVGMSQVYSKVENHFLYTLCGNKGAVNLNTCPFLKYGAHTVSATAFTRNRAKGRQVGPGTTLTFSIAPPQTTTTNVPTKSPTKAPSKAPIKDTAMDPVQAPTQSPIMNLVGALTKGPTTAPSKAPIKNTAMDPVQAPTQSPIMYLVGAPTKGPTKAPSKAPIKNTAMDPVKAPTKAPTTGSAKLPDEAPTKSPAKTLTFAPMKSPSTKVPTMLQTQEPAKPPSAAPMNAPAKGLTKSPTTAVATSPTRTPNKKFNKAADKCSVEGSHQVANKISYEASYHATDQESYKAAYREAHEITDGSSHF